MQNRRLAGGDYTDRDEDKKDEELCCKIIEENFVEMAKEEEFILTITADGMGKRTSAYDYRVSKRGGKGIDSIDLKRLDNNTQSFLLSQFFRLMRL